MITRGSNAPAPPPPLNARALTHANKQFILTHANEQLKLDIKLRSVYVCLKKKQAAR